MLSWAENNKEGDASFIKEGDDSVTAAQATAAAAAAAKGEEVTYPSRLATRRKDKPTAAVSLEVDRCHVCFGSCTLKGVDRWGSCHRQSGGYTAARVVNSSCEASRKGLTSGR